MARRKEQAEGIRQALEGALVAAPDELANHMAFADWLSEQDDENDRARGEFIGVQLALEDVSLPVRERARLARRERELCEAHQRDWLGGLATFLLDEHPLEDWAGLQLSEGTPIATFAFRRGWLDRLHVNSLNLAFARALKDAPATRLLRELVVEYIQDCEGPRPTPEDGVPPDERWPGLHPLRGSSTLGNVRHFRLGPDQGDDFRNFRCYVKSHVTAQIVGLMPRLEELYLWCNEFDLNEVLTLPTLSNLRELLIYHAAQVHRLQYLDRPTFRNLTRLHIHPHHLAYTCWDHNDEAGGYRLEDGYLPLSIVRPVLRSKHLTRLADLRLRCSSMGDEGCREIVASGILMRLKRLDLRHGCVTDDGALALADCPDVRNLEWLDLDRNGLSASGIERLKRLGIPLRADSQQAEAELHPIEGYRMPQYLYEGEFE